MFGRVSRIENRREAEYLGALGIRPARASHSESVLVAGNSLLLLGVNFPQLQRQLAPDLELRRAVVEGTYYLDWYYGLRRLFEAGAQPDAVVLVLNPVQLTSHAIGGDYTAHFMVDRKDLLHFATDIGADRNRLSSLALANLSFFYGTRAEIRNWILGQIIPDLPLLTHNLQPQQQAPDYYTAHALGMQRLRQLGELCRQHGAALVFVIPPANEDVGATAVAREAIAEGVTVLMPIAPGVLPRSDYSDGFHLNSEGAGKFTPALATGLRNVLESGSSRNQTATTNHSPNWSGWPITGAVASISPSSDNSSSDRSLSDNPMEPEGSGK
jgi:hypothetical protein